MSTLNIRKLEGFNPERDLVRVDSAGIPPVPPSSGIYNSPGPAAVRQPALNISVQGSAAVNTGSPVHGGLVPVPSSEGRIILAGATERGDLLFFEPRGDGLAVTGKIALSGTITTPLSYGSGLLFCVTAEGLVCAVETLFGDDLPGGLKNRVAWQRKMKKGAVSGPLAGDGFILVSQLDGIYALLASGDRGKAPGSVLWGASLTGAVLCPDIHESMILAGTEDRRLILFDYSADQPVVRWQCDLSGPCRSAAALCGEHGLAAAGTVDGYVYCAGSAAGDRKWSFNAGSPVLSGITADTSSGPGCFFFGTENGVFYSLDQGGRRVWQTGTGAGISSGALVRNGLVCFGCGDELLCLDAASGSVLFRFRTEGAVSGRPAESGGSIYFGTVRGTVYRLITG